MKSPAPLPGRATRAGQGNGNRTGVNRPGSASRALFQPDLIPPARLRQRGPCGKDRPLCRGLRADSVITGACCRSSVVEHSIGNGEVDSSILSGSTSYLHEIAGIYERAGGARRPLRSAGWRLRAPSVFANLPHRQGSPCAPGFAMRAHARPCFGRGRAWGFRARMESGRLRTGNTASSPRALPGGLGVRRGVQGQPSRSSSRLSELSEADFPTSLETQAVDRSGWI